MKKNSNPTIEIEQIRDKDQALLEIKFRDDKKKISLITERGKIETSMVTCNKNGGTLNMIYVVFEDGSLVAISHSKSTVKWVREEALADMAVVQLVDAANRLSFDGEEDQIDQDLPQLRKNEDLLEQFIRRIRRHANQIHSLLRHIVTVKDIASFFIDQNGQNSDQFGIRKVIVAVTRNDKIYGLDSKTGRILWQSMIPGGVEWKKDENSPYLFLQRPANFYGMDAKCALVYRNLETLDMQRISFNPLTGRIDNNDIQSLGSGSIVKAFLLHHSTEDNIRPLVILNKNNQVTIVPEYAIREIKSLSGKIFIASVGQDGEKITGQRLQVTEGNIRT